MIPLTSASDSGLNKPFENIFTPMPVGIAHLDLQGKFCWVNPQLCEWLGYTQAELLQQSLWELIPPHEQTYLQQQFWELQDSASISQDQQFLDRHQLNLWGHLTLSILPQSFSRPNQVLLILQDIHDRKLLEEKLHSSQRQMRAVFEAMQDIVLICTIQDETLTGIEIAPTAPLQSQTGVPEWINQTIQFLWQDTALWKPRLQQVLQTDETVSFEYGLPVEGCHHWFTVTLSAMSENTVLWVARNISDRKQMEQDLFQEKELAEVTLQSIGDAVITTSIDSTITNINPAAEALTGWDKTDAQGKPLSQVFNIIDEDSRDTIANPVTTVLKQGKIIEPSHHTLLIARDGKEYAIDELASPIRNHNGQIIGVILVFSDVTQARNTNRQLSWEANHDPLTHLLNRRKFEQLLREALRDAQQDQQQHVLCFLDLDQFKIINDTCGHNTGDDLLCQIAKILQDSIRASDTLARLGGDEFAILLRQCTLAPAQKIAEKLRRNIQDFRLTWGAQTFQVGVSIGLVQIDHQSLSVEALLNAADSGCYHAKQQGKNRVQVYQPNDASQLQPQGEQHWNLRIQKALASDRFCLYGQAIVPTDVPPNQVDQIQPPTNIYELLLRMRDDQNKIVKATAFMSAAERYNLIQEIDRWAIQHILDHFETLRQLSSGSAESQLFMINLSTHSLKDDAFLEFLKLQLEQHSAIAKHLCFAITETAILSLLQSQKAVMQALHKLGCQFALEDCGGNLSAFINLKSLPIDYVKIEGRLIEDIDKNLTTYAIVEALQHISHRLGLKTIAKGVDNHLIRKKLQEIGVNYIQGVEIKRPTNLLATRKSS